jgi:hypothetical protein
VAEIVTVWIAPSASRWWRFKYRFAGKEKRISLGVYPDVGLKKAHVAMSWARSIPRHQPRHLRSNVLSRHRFRG